MNGGNQLDEIEITLGTYPGSETRKIYISVHDHGLARKWLCALENLLRGNYMLEKNFCFLGFADSTRDGEFILEQLNTCIAMINAADIGYQIADHFTMQNTMTDQPLPGHPHGRNLLPDRMNQLHRYFEDLQGTSRQISKFYHRADGRTRWCIRQLNLLCHEFESWALSWRKQIEAPDWQRPTMLMCWLAAPRFLIEPEDLEHFGIRTLNRPTGGVYVGVNKAVGKHHWEVFCDEGRDLDQLVTSALRSQTEAAGDFDIEWGRNPEGEPWQTARLDEFRAWLRHNGFDPDDPALTIGHPQVGQVDLKRSFGTENLSTIWSTLNSFPDVVKITTSSVQQHFNYHWWDHDFQDRQIEIISEK